MICNVCTGCGCILVHKPSIEWWDCPACMGAGVRIQHGPAFIKTGIKETNYSKSKGGIK